MSVIPEIIQHGKEFVFEMLRRHWRDKSTIGDVFAGDKTVYTLEDPWTSKTAPFQPGKYRMRLAESPRLKKLPPEKLARLENDPTVIWIDGVPGHSALQFHPGYDQQDTDGCVIPGLQVGEDCVFQSTAAFLYMRAMLRDAEGKGQELWLNVQETERPKPAEKKGGEN